MENQQYLNERSYKKIKKGLIIAGCIIIVLGLCLGGFLIKKGIDKIKSPDVSELDQTNKNQEQEKNQLKEKLEKEKEELLEQLAPLKGEQHQEFVKNGFSEKYYKLDNEIDKIEGKVREIEQELVKNNASSVVGDVTDFAAGEESRVFFGILFFLFGGASILFSLSIGGTLIAHAFRREVIAFGAQQVMPVAQEIVDKAAPTLGNAGSEIARGITKGIHDGLNGNNEDNNQNQ